MKLIYSVFHHSYEVGEAATSCPFQPDACFGFVHVHPAVDP